MKHILLVCGTGVATSTVARSRVSAYLDAHGYKGKYTVEQGKIAEVGGLSPRADVCVSTVKFDEKMCKCPLIIGTAILMGINTEPVYKQLMEILDK